MASVHMRGGRDPLFDPKTQAMIERRLQELFGLGLLLLAVAAALMLASYSPNDPGWFVATDAPAQNALGRFGAAVASTFILIGGIASWVIPFMLGVWGVRLMLHIGAERGLRRNSFALLAVAMASIFSASLPVGDSWPHNFGLGGLFGDTLLGTILGISPVDAGTGLLVLPLVLGLLSLGAVGFVSGLTRKELRIGAQVALFTLAYAYNAAVRLVTLVFQRGQKAYLRRHPVSPIVKNAVMASASQSAAPLQVPRVNISALPLGLAAPPAAPSALPQDERLKLRISEVIKTRLTLSATPQQVRKEPTLAASMDDAVIDLYAAPQPQIHAAPPSPPAQKDVVSYPSIKTAPLSTRAAAEVQPQLRLEPDTQQVFDLPPLALLTAPSTVVRHQLSDESLNENARLLESVLEDYGVRGEIVSVRPGPVVTMYELEPAPGLKASRVIGLSDDIARSMSALSARVSTVPGRSVIGIELPNEVREKVVLREILSARSFGDSNMRLPLALGKDISGEPIVANLAKMPHLLIAGTTGSGKSVAINTMILSLLYKLTPEECRMIMIDPKMLELSVYDGIPHLLAPVVTDPKKAVGALKWVVGEMEERYRKMSKMGVRNIEGYNGRVTDALSRGEMFKRTIQTGFDEDTGEPVFETEEFEPKAFPFIVVVVDEMADLMMVAGKEIEACIQRLAQMARASGIHLIMATQRPSVDVITGTIKANFPTRISFQVTSKIDSRTILGEQGAEQLLGMGDMLYMGNGAKIVRIHGPFVSDEEVEDVVRHLKSYGPPEYMSGVIDGPDEDAAQDIDMVLGLSSGDNDEDALYNQAVAIVAKDRKCSTSYIQRKLGLGYNKAARLVERMEENHIVSSANQVGKREILIPEV